MKQPIELLLQLLLRGGRVKHDGYEYAMGEDCSLCAILHYESGEEVPMKIDIDLPGFNKLANDIGRDELILANCSMSLQEQGDLP